VAEAIAPGSKREQQRVMHSLSGARVIVVGGAGFVGSQTVRELLSRGASVTVYDDLSAGDAAHLEEVKDDAHLVIGSVLDEPALSRVFAAARPDYVVDLVGDTFVPDAYQDPKRFLRINIEGTLNVLLAALRADVCRVIYASSTEVYGETRGGPANEDCRYNPVNTYAVSKLAADRLCYTFHAEHGLPVIIARLFNCYGPRATHPYVIPEVVAQLSRGNTVTLGNVSARRDFTYVEDTAHGLLAALQSDVPDGEAVNIGSGTSASVREVVSLVAEIYGRASVEIRHDPARERRVDVDEFVSDSSKLRKSSGWAPVIGLREGLERTVLAYREAGERWTWERRGASWLNQAG
jgi:nucleoside-diphosphate-sugar epimerase